jgi:hypothetical protein
MMRTVRTAQRIRRWDEVAMLTPFVREMGRKNPAVGRVFSAYDLRIADGMGWMGEYKWLLFVCFR